MYTPPIFSVNSIQAETINAAVGFCPLGLVQIESQSAYLRRTEHQFLEIIVKADMGKWALLWTNH